MKEKRRDKEFRDSEAAKMREKRKDAAAEKQKYSVGDPVIELVRRVYDESGSAVIQNSQRLHEYITPSCLDCLGLLRVPFLVD